MKKKTRSSSKNFALTSGWSPGHAHTILFRLPQTEWSCTYLPNEEGYRKLSNDLYKKISTILTT
ncbi:hypothetical protein RYH73_19420 [Olivibacter sp. CPCC 100613]|uniref:hypothetical protein n=1 Tax=Olivibacter sp. CPCC 100613 TaxID=3079931 RepID=UPI002FFB10F1